MDRDWAHLASRLAEARGRTGMSQRAVAAQLDVSRSTIQNMEDREHSYAKVQLVHLKAAQLYGWADGSVDRVLDGEEPILTSGEQVPLMGSDAVRAALEELTAGMSPRAREALTRGRTVDTVVVDLAAGDPDATAVLIYKQGDDSGASPEEKRRVLRKWAKLQRAALEIFSEDE